MASEDVTMNSTDASAAAPATTTATKDLAKQKEQTIRQIEFYFADSNLPYDRFMWTLYAKDPEHWVPIATVASFKRMREYAANGIPWVAEALRASEFLEVDAAGEKVRRRTEVKEPKSADERSVYAKGFEEETPETQGKLEEFFQGYASTNAVRMRRDQHKKFKLSVFVEFTEPGGVDAFLTATPKPTWAGQELVIMTKEAYCDMKIKEKGLSGRAADLRRDNMGQRKFNAFKLSESDKAALASGADIKTKPAEKKEPELFLEFFGKQIRITKIEDGENAGQGTVDSAEVPYTKRATLKFEGAGKEWSWSDIKLPIKDLFEGKTPFIQADREAPSGLVGFSKALSDEEVEKVKKGIPTLGGQPITWSDLAEDEEKAFQVNRAQTAARAIYKNAIEEGSGSGNSSGRGNSRGRGGRGRGRGGDRGGRGGRGRGRGGRGGGDRNAERAAAAAKDGAAGGEAGGEGKSGEKRKRAIEPDGGPHVGIRGAGADGPPAIQTTKKAKVDA